VYCKVIIWLKILKKIIKIRILINQVLRHHQAKMSKLDPVQI